MSSAAPVWFAKATIVTLGQARRWGARHRARRGIGV